MRGISPPALFELRAQGGRLQRLAECPIHSSVKRMWIGGREVSLETRHTRLYDNYLNRPVITK